MNRVLLLLILFFCVACSVPMYKSPGLGIPRNLPRSAVMSSIKKGVQLANLQVQRVKGNEVIAYVKEDDAEVSIQIKYQPRSRIISFRHLDSKNMDYHSENGQEDIHFSYNILLDNLEKQIALRIARMSAR